MGLGMIHDDPTQSFRVKLKHGFANFDLPLQISQTDLRKLEKILSLCEIEGDAVEPEVVTPEVLPASPPS